MADFRGPTIISFRKKSGFPNVLSLDPKLSVGSQIKGKSGSQPSTPPSEQPAGEGEEWGGGVATFQVTPPSIHFLINTEVTTLKTTKQGPEVDKKSRNAKSQQNFLFYFSKTNICAGAPGGPHGG